MDREVLTWPRYAEAARELAANIGASGYQPDVVLAIARGGLIPAGSLSYALSVKNTSVVNVEYYTGVNERLELPVILPPPLNLVDLADARMLVVDDVADTGHTLQLVCDFCAPHVAEVRSAVLYHKPRSVVMPDYVWRSTDKWIDFPWSTGSAIVAPPAPREAGQAPASPSPS